MQKKEKDTFLKCFGKNLAEIRKKKDVSQDQLAFDADIDLSTISKIEQGRLNVSIFNTYKIAKALNISHQDMFDFEFPTSKK